MSDFLPTRKCKHHMQTLDVGELVIIKFQCESSIGLLLPRYLD